MTDHQKLRQLAENATPGPWRSADGGFVIMSGDVTDEDSLLVTEVESAKMRDVQFIAAANPVAVLAILDELQALRAGYDEMESRRSAELDAAMSAGWDECAEHLGASDAATMDRPVTYLIAANPYRSQS